jgi:hypothetical protein
MDKFPVEYLLITAAVVAIMIWAISILFKDQSHKPIQEDKIKLWPKDTKDYPVRHMLECRYNDHHTPFDDDYQFIIEDGKAQFCSPAGKIIEKRSTAGSKCGVYLFRYNKSEYIATVHS